jgi:hypothetical protein
LERQIYLHNAPVRSFALLLLDLAPAAQSIVALSSCCTAFDEFNFLSGQELNTDKTCAKERTAKDSPRRLLNYFYLVCWIVWMLVAGLSVWALYMTKGRSMPFGPAQVLTAFWWTTYFCLGLPAAVWLMVWWVERRRL